MFRRTDSANSSWKAPDEVIEDSLARVNQLSHPAPFNHRPRLRGLHLPGGLQVKGAGPEL